MTEFTMQSCSHVWLACLQSGEARPLQRLLPGKLDVRLQMRHSLVQHEEHHPQKLAANRKFKVRAKLGFSSRITCSARVRPSGRTPGAALALPRPPGTWLGPGSAQSRRPSARSPPGVSCICFTIVDRRGYKFCTPPMSDHNKKGGYIQ